MFGAYENPSDNDYITRSEFDDQMQAMDVIGDGETIAVSNELGGRVVRCTIPTTPISEYTPTPIFVSSYNSSASTYTVSWDAFTMWANYYGDIVGTTSKRYWSQVTVPTGSFVFTAAVYAPTSKLYIQPTLEVTTGPYLSGCRVDLKWGGGLTGSDADTQNAEMDDPDADQGRIGSNVTVLSGGSASAKAALTIDWENTQVPIVEFGYAYDKQTTTISMPIHSQYSSDSKPDFWSKNIGASFDDELILGWDSNPTDITLDALANSASYDDYQRVGYAKTDSSGYIKAAVKYGDYVNRPFGVSGTIENGSGFAYVANGLVWRITT